MLLKINKNPSHKDLRWFGVTILIGFGLIGALCHWRGKIQTAEWMWEASSFVFAISFIFPRAAKWLYLAWMSAGFVIGSIVSRILLTIIFFIIVTPVALIFKVMNRDALRLRRDPHAKSYWKDHPDITDRSYYERLF
jgi:hypothetical protein